MDTFNWDQIYNHKYLELTSEGMSDEEAHIEASEHASGLEDDYLRLEDIKEQRKSVYED